MRSCAQGVFRNLDFESASVPDLPVNQWEFVSVSQGLPGWAAYWGTNSNPPVTHNSITTGGVNVGILGPSMTPGYVIRGNYTAVLQAGYNYGLQAAAISQVGLVPAAAQALEFKSGPYNSDFLISLGGQAVPMTLVAKTSAFWLYRGDVQPFQGQITELRITALLTHYPGWAANLVLDDLAFTVPEPSTFRLFAFGALFLICPQFRKRA